MTGSGLGSLVVFVAGMVLVGGLARAVSGALAIARDEVLYRAVEGRVRVKA